jgi:nucleotide-binding universal stress UspA family protein
MNRRGVGAATVAAVAGILVGYDGTASGRRALERAAEEAREHHARVTVLSVVDMPLNPEEPRNFGTYDDISGEEGQSYGPPPETVEHLREARELLGAAGVDPELAWAVGDPGPEIVQFAKRINARTIVVGEHHHGFLSRTFGGDIDGEVEREAGCNVILA